MSTAPQRPSVSVGATRNISASFEFELDEGEKLSGVPTITEDTTSDLTITNKVVSDSVLNINNVDVPIAEAVQCSISGFSSGNFPYTISIAVSTNAVPPQNLIGKIIISEKC